MRRFVEHRVRPEVGDWYEAGRSPARELDRELVGLGGLGPAAGAPGVLSAGDPQVDAADATGFVDGAEVADVAGDAAATRRTAAATAGATAGSKTLGMM